MFQRLLIGTSRSRTASVVAWKEMASRQPIVNAAAILPWPRWLPRPHSRRTRATAATIRRLIADLVTARAAAIAAGTAPDDLATKIMTTADPLTGRGFTPAEMVDQVAIFFLAGHETSASALAWSLWLLAAFPDWQDRVAAEARAVEYLDLGYPLRGTVDTLSDGLHPNAEGYSIIAGAFLAAYSAHEPSGPAFPDCGGPQD